MKSVYLNENSVDFKSLCYSIPPPTVEIVAVGAISGLISSKVLVNENDEKDIDLEPIDQTFSRVVLTEVKDKVTRVIRKLTGIHASNIISSDHILTAIEEVCDANISKEVKLIIADITNNILSKTVENTHDNMDTNTNNIQEGITFQETCGSAYLQTNMCVDDIIDQIIISKTTSSLSTITSDVHMQHTCLQKTGDRLTKKRTSRRMYNQIHVSNIPFQPGDSGTCIYTKTPIQGCIGMAIANHPEGGCIATPIKEILKHFKIKIR